MPNTYIDFFAGCGGLSLGLGEAGWEGIFAIEKDPMAYKTFYRNLINENSVHYHFNKWPEWLEKSPHDIEDVLDNINIVKKFKELKGKVTLVAGGPPCQGFSVAGARKGNDPRNLLVFKQIKAIKILRPRFALIENVGGFEKKFVCRPSDSTTVSIAEEAINALESIGYNVGKVKINAADYGVPQVRERVIIFGIRKDFAGEVDAAALLTDYLAKVSYEQCLKFGLPTERYVNIEEAISDLSGENTVEDPEFPKYKTSLYLPPTSKYQKLMRKNSMSRRVPNCHRFNNHSMKSIALYKKALETQPAGRLTKEFLYANGCHSNKRFVLDTKKPCSTLTTAPEELIHYKHPRVVTLREMARLQSFPDDFEFLGRYTLNGPCRGIDVPRNAQIGNAIPPLVGLALGSAVSAIANAIICNDQGLQKYRKKKRP